MHFLAFFIALSVSTITFAEERLMHSGVVTHIYDGDTIEITSNNEKRLLRLAHIDAPEVNQKFGDRAKRNLEKTILNNTVRYEVVGTDIFQRATAVVFLEQININKKQIHDGYAWSLNRTSSNLYLSLEFRAKHYKKGLWQSSNYLSPWVFRKQFLSDNIN